MGNKNSNLFEENLVSFNYRKVRDAALYKKSYHQEVELSLPDDSPFLVKKREHKEFGFYRETIYTVKAGQLNLLQVTGIFQEPESNVAEIEFEVFYEFTPFNKYVRSYTSICPIRTPNQDRDCIEKFKDASFGKDEDTGVKLKLKATAKKMNTGWKLE